MGYITKVLTVEVMRKHETYLIHTDQPLKGCPPRVVMRILDDCTAIFGLSIQGHLHYRCLALLGRALLLFREMRFEVGAFALLEINILE
jgi:hypothetical protein